MNHMESKFFLFGLLLVAICILPGCGVPAKTGNTGNPPAKAPVPAETAPVWSETAATASEPYLGQQAGDNDARKKLCSWVDGSDIIIKVNVPPGLEKDTSYEVGFYFSPIFSTMKLAREGCEYRTGFDFSEFMNKGQAEVGVRGYSDNRRRTLKEGTIPVSFGQDGRPDIGTRIEVTIMD
jgi:hypothetical protein